MDAIERHSMLVGGAAFAGAVVISAARHGLNAPTFALLALALAMVWAHGRLGR